MSRFLWFTTRLVWLVVRIVALATSIYVFVLRPWERSWLATAEEAAKALPGDDLVPEAMVSETRAITIEAPPSKIWPWLVQMGFGRAGWYSYDRMDMRGASADTVNPDWQHLEVGELIRTHPEGGFKVADLEPERSLVLYMDTETIGAPRTHGEGAVAEETPAGLRMAGAIGSMTFAEFKGTWTIYLDPIDERQTRLIERFRLTMPDQPASRIAGPALGFGVFLMTRKQMLGIKSRAEREAAAGPKPAVRAPMPA